MERLNRQAAHLFQQVGVHACTDVTGFAFLGHSSEMAEKGKVRLRFRLSQLPFLEGARGYAEEWLFPGGACRNKEYYQRWVDFASEIVEEMQMLLFTPETSGGLLAAVDPHKVDTLTALFAREGQPCWVVGEVAEGERIEVLP